MLVLGYYTVKQGTGIAARYLEARLGKPSLIQETSRLSLKEAFKHPIKTTKRLMSKPEDVLKEIKLNVNYAYFHWLCFYLIINYSSYTILYESFNLFFFL